MGYRHSIRIGYGADGTDLIKTSAIYFDNLCLLRPKSFFSSRRAPSHSFNDVGI
jgi:hypothetical protein